MSKFELLCKLLKREPSAMEKRINFAHWKSRPDVFSRLVVENK